MSCSGYSTSGSWSKITNGSQSEIAYINGTNVTMTPFGSFCGYSVYSNMSPNGQGIKIVLTVNNTDHGLYKCCIGTDSHLLSVPLSITTSSMTGNTHIQMVCQPTDRNTDPYTVMFFLNSTLVMKVKIQNGTEQVTMMNNTVFSTNGKFGHHPTGVASYAGNIDDGPTCLTCIVSANNSYGDATKCTKGARDVYGTSQGNGPVNDMTLALSSDSKYEDDVNTKKPEDSPTGSHLVVVAVILVVAVLASVFIIHNRGKRRPMTYDQYVNKVYKPCNRRESHATEVTTVL